MATITVFPARGTTKRLLLCKLGVSDDCQRIFPLLEAEDDPRVLEMWVSRSCPTECCFVEAATAHFPEIKAGVGALADDVLDVRLRTD